VTTQVRLAAMVAAVSQDRAAAVVNVVTPPSVATADAAIRRINASKAT